MGYLDFAIGLRPVRFQSPFTIRKLGESKKYLNKVRPSRLSTMFLTRATSSPSRMPKMLEIIFTGEAIDGGAKIRSHSSSDEKG